MKTAFHIHSFLSGLAACIGEMFADSRRRSGVIRSLLLLFVMSVGIVRGQGQDAPEAQPGPQDFDSLAASAASAREGGDLPRAIEFYARAELANPRWADGWFALGMLRYQANDFAEARDAFTHWIELSPDSATGFALRGLCEFETADYVGSLNDIERGVALGAASQSRNAGILRYHQAMLLTRFSRFDESLSLYKQLATGENATPEMKVGIGLAGMRIALLPVEATADQSRLLSMAGEAGFQWMAGDEQASSKAFEALFREYPTASNAHFFYGYLRVEKDPHGSITEFRRELAVTPGNATAASALASVLLVEERPADALPYAEEAATEQPSLPSSQFLLGESLAETGDITDGIEHLEMALKLDSDNFLAHVALATAFSRAGREEDAWRERQLSIQMAKAGNSSARP